MERIIDILHKGEYSCVMKNREEVRTFTQRGVADLYDLYRSDPAYMGLDSAEEMYPVIQDFISRIRRK